MPKITDKEKRKFGHDRWCGICHKLIPTGMVCYVRQEVLVGECHKVWMEKSVAPDPPRRKHRGKLKAVSAQETQDIKDASHYAVVFGRHLLRENKNIVGIRKAIKDYEGSFNDW